MKRRSFLRKTSAGALSVSAASSTVAQVISSKSVDQPQITIVGAGVFGVWTAFYMQQAGAQVTLIDAYGPGNSRASSGGESRILRSDYGDLHHYTKMSINAHQLWLKWQEEWNAEFMYSTGKLSFHDESSRAKVEKTSQFLASKNQPSELLTSDEIHYRWPQINAEGIDFAVYYPGHAGGSALMAREACHLVCKKFQEAGGVLKIDSVHVTRKQGKVNAQLKDGTTIKADKLIFACGPWIGKLFPELFENQLKVYRRDVFFVGPAAGDDRYSYPNMPIWSFSNAEDARYYGLPDLKGRGVKIAPWPDLNAIDMDQDDRFNNLNEVKGIRRFIDRRFPGLAGQPFLEGRVCQLTMKDDEEFIIDQHPDDENIWFACSGSGHAFKHGPALGAYISKRILKGKVEKEYEGRFGLVLDE